MDFPARVLLAALDASANGVVITDRAGTIRWVNSAFTRMTGYSFEQTAGQNPRLLKSGAHSRGFYEDLWNTLLSGNVWAGTMVNRRKDGSTYFEEQTITPVRDKGGAISHFVAIKQDVTARRQAEDTLRESEHRYRLLAENVTDVISAFDMDLRPTYVSPSILALRGYTVEEVMAQSMEEYLTPASWEIAKRTFAEELATERGGQGNPARTRTLELELPCKDGSRVWVESKISFLRDANGQPQELIAVSRDISERKRAEADKAQVEGRVRHAQKMEAVGRLAAGIAHDFNNILTVIIGRSQIASYDLPGDSAVRRHLQDIEHTGKRAAGLTRQLLAFSSQQVLEPREVDLNVVVAGVERILRWVIGEEIELETVLDPGLGITKVDPSQLEQVLLNLAVNSRDAMPQGGRLAIETANLELDAVHEQSHPGVLPGLYVVLTVSDTGHGMDAATRARIFEPFFTTKEPEKGTGLGLATVHGIVEQSGGTILVYSEIRQGTTFRIYLPRVPAPTQARTSAAAAVTPPRGTETILLVEDDKLLRETIREILEAMGYVMLAAPGPDQALALAAHHERINLLVTDVVMPRMNGFILGEHLKRAHPRMRVLYMSGYAGNVIAAQSVTAPGISLLQKPFTVEILTARVREVLDAPLA